MYKVIFACLLSSLLPKDKSDFVEKSNGQEVKIKVTMVLRSSTWFPFPITLMENWLSYFCKICSEPFLSYWQTSNATRIHQDQYSIPASQHCHLCKSQTDVRNWSLYPVLMTPFHSRSFSILSIRVSITFSLDLWTKFGIR